MASLRSLKDRKNYMPKLERIKTKYVQVKTNPEETQRRLDNAFDIIFNEVNKFTTKRGFIKNK